jgi:hypothetical protein
MTVRGLAGVGCLFVSAVLIAFLADANYSALGAHPGRIVIAVGLIALAVTSLASGIGLLRAGSRGK